MSLKLTVTIRKRERYYIVRVLPELGVDTQKEEREKKRKKTGKKLSKYIWKRWPGTQYVTEK